MSLTRKKASKPKISKSNYVINWKRWKAGPFFIFLINWFIKNGSGNHGADSFAFIARKTLQSNDPLHFLIQSGESQPMESCPYLKSLWRYLAGPISLIWLGIDRLFSKPKLLITDRKILFHYFPNLWFQVLWGCNGTEPDSCSTTRSSPPAYWIRGSGRFIPVFGEPVYMAGQAHVVGSPPSLFWRWNPEILLHFKNSGFLMVWKNTSR